MYFVVKHENHIEVTFQTYIKGGCNHGQLLFIFLNIKILHFKFQVHTLNFN